MLSRSLRSALAVGGAWVFIAASSCDEGSTRCSHDTDCDAGQICSNAKDQRAVGLCVAPCSEYVGVASCSASASASASAAGSSGGAGASGAAGASGNAGTSGSGGAQ